MPSSCPSCGRALSTVSALECPFCGVVFAKVKARPTPTVAVVAAGPAPFTVPVVAPALPPPPAPAATGVRPCPFCAEEIRVEAIKCKHCGSDLTPAAAPAQVAKAREERGYAIGVSLLLLGLFLLFVFNAYSGLLLVLVIVASAAWVYIDASDINRRHPPAAGTRRWSPESWCAVVALLWIIGLPVYLSMRRKTLLSIPDPIAGAVSEHKPSSGWRIVGRLLVWVVVIVAAVALILYVVAKRDLAS